MKQVHAIGLLIAVMLMGVACSGGGDAEPGPEPTNVKRATAYINPTSGNEVFGSAIFINEGDKITVQVHLENAPVGEHAVHIHEIGDCSAEDGSSAGGHWNPTGMDHGKWGAEPHHLGDIGNVVVGEDGKGDLTLTSDLWAMGSTEANDFMGKSVIVHADVDDFTTQPTGAAGGRIGCGVIK